MLHFSLKYIFCERVIIRNFYYIFCERAIIRNFYYISFVLTKQDTCSITADLVGWVAYKFVFIR